MMNGSRTPRRPAPNYLSRSVQLRLLLVTGSLIIVLILMSEARKPERWQWMWNPVIITRDEAAEALDSRPQRPAARASRLGVVQGLAGPRARLPEDSGEDADKAFFRRAAWTYVLDDLSREDRQELQRGLLAARWAGPSSLDVATWRTAFEALSDGWVSYVRAQRVALDAAVDVGSEQRSRWQSEAEAVVRRWRELEQPALRAPLDGRVWTQEELQVLASLQAEIDTISLSKVRDDTVFLPEEQYAWFRLFERLQHSSGAELERQSSGEVSFVQLFRQPGQYRGRLITMRGVVRLAYRVTAPVNAPGIDHYYVLWVQPAGGHRIPLMIYSLELPHGFPLLPDDSPDRQTLDESVRVTGFFFKRQVYRARDGASTAPVLLARTPVWLPTPAAVRPPTPSIMAVIGAVVAMGTLGGVSAWAVWRSTRRRGAVVARISDPAAEELAALRDRDRGTRIGPVLLIAVLMLPARGLGQEGNETLLPQQGVKGTRQFLALYGVDDAQWSRLRDGERVTADEEAIIRRILFRLAQVAPADLDRWTAPFWDTSFAEGAAAEYRGDAFRISGRVRDLLTVSVPQDQALGLGMDHYYRIEIDPPERGPPITMFAGRVPAAWENEQPLGEPVGASAVFLKLGPPHRGVRPLVFATARVGWFPDAERPDLGVGPHQVLLGKLGMDLALFDDVRPRNGRTVTPVEAECFYQLLSTLGRASSESLADRAGSFQLQPVLETPQTQHGEIRSLQGTVRRITKVIVDDALIRQRFGIDAYYQLDFFVPLEGEIVRLGQGNAGQDPPIFTNTYPVTACVLDLPPGVTVGDDLNEEVRLTAVFFKLWVYRSQYLSSFADSPSQPSPMLLGRAVQRVGPPPSSGRRTFLLGGGFLALLVAIWLMLWRTGRRDARFTRTVLRRQ